MKHEELIKHLREREKELVKELEAIRTLVGVYTGDTASVPATHTEDDNKDNSDIEPKGKRTWEDYALYVLKEIGGRGKAADVVRAAINVNPNETQERIKSAIRSKLSKLYNKNVINATKGKYPKDGYIYEIKIEP